MESALVHRGTGDEGGSAAPLAVVAAAVVEDGRLLVVSKKAAPGVFYLPGGKPEPGEDPEETLAREFAEELGVAPVRSAFLAEIEDIAALERVPMRLTLFTADLDGTPTPAAELADLRWIQAGGNEEITLAPALGNFVIPLLTRAGALR